MGRDGSGVTEHAGKIRLSFQYQGARCRETLDLAATTTNIRAAERTLARIRDEIRLGVFDYAKHFPKSKRATVSPGGPRGKTLGQAITDFLATKADKSANTKKLYRNAGEVWKVMFGEENPLSEFTSTKVKTTIAGHPFASPKLRNDYMIVLRGALNLFGEDHPEWANPIATVKNAKRQKPQPKPLSRSEMGSVIEYMRVSEDPRVHAYFVWMFETGERPEEAIAHQWRDVDWERKTVHVERARSCNVTGPVKTHEVRDIDLSPAALDALRAMTTYTQRSGEPCAEIFQNPQTKKPWNDSRAQHDTYWKRALVACKLAPRRAYNTRHTYATIRLMLGAVPAYISRQLGHESAIMLFKTYAKWIDADKTERDRVQKLLLGGNVPGHNSGHSRVLEGVEGD